MKYIYQNNKKIKFNKFYLNQVLKIFNLLKINYNKNKLK